MLNLDVDIVIKYMMIFSVQWVVDVQKTLNGIIHLKKDIQVKEMVTKEISKKESILILIIILGLLILVFCFFLFVKSKGSQCIADPRSYLIDSLSKGNHYDIDCCCYIYKNMSEGEIFRPIAPICFSNAKQCVVTSKSKSFNLWNY